MSLEAVLGRLRAEMRDSCPGVEWDTLQTYFLDEQKKYLEKNPEKTVSAVAHAYRKSMVLLTMLDIGGYYDEIRKETTGYQRNEAND